MTGDKHWQDATLAQRKAIYEAYLLCDSYPKASFEQADACWTGARLDIIQYTFCPLFYWDTHKLPNEQKGLKSPFQ